MPGKTFPTIIEGNLMSFTVAVIILLSLLGLGIAFYYMRKVSAIPLDMGLDAEESGRIKSIHGAIAEGAMAFLKQEYKVLVVFMLAFALIIGVLVDDQNTPD